MTGTAAAAAELERQLDPERAATTPPRRANQLPLFDRSVLVLQGGGALGAYQAGVYEALMDSGCPPDWVAGVSIGALNAALIAGNPPERRIERLNMFWNRLSANLPAPFAPESGPLRVAFNKYSAALHAAGGVPGMFSPRLLPPSLQPSGSDGALGIYDTAPLRETLLELVDFDLINAKKVRLSVGAVNVRTGNSKYFDNFAERIGPEHIMASTALPPAFPPVHVRNGAGDDEAYWDGGILSNTPLQYVLDSREALSLRVLSVDLFPAAGQLPRDLSDVMSRQKDIAYSSRTRYNTDMVAKVQNTRKAMRDALGALPEPLRDDPAVKALQDLLRTSPVNILHLIYRQRAFEQESRDYEFSRVSVREHWQAGAADMRESLEHPERLKQSGLDDGVTMFDLVRDGAV